MERGPGGGTFTHDSNTTPGIPNLVVVWGEVRFTENVSLPRVCTIRRTVSGSLSGDCCWELIHANCLLGSSPSTPLVIFDPCFLPSGSGTITKQGIAGIGLAAGFITAWLELAIGRFANWGDRAADGGSRPVPRRFPGMIGNCLFEIPG